MSDDNDQNVYIRIKTVLVGDAIDDRTGESMVVLFLKVLTEGDASEDYRFALPEDKAQALGKLLLSDDTKSYQKH